MLRSLKIKLCLSHLNVINKNGSFLNRFNRNSTKLRLTTIKEYFSFLNLKEMRLSFFLLTIVSVLFVLHCKADLPIHCLRSQVLGSWKLFITEPTDSNKTLTCGHETPDDPARSYLALRSDFAPSQVYTVSLEKEHQVKHNGSVVGNWTMIYDEGYDIRFNNKRFVAFFDYYPNETGQVVSYCGGTVVGWYLDSSSGKRACFKGEKIISNENEKLTLIGVPLKQVSVVQPTVTGFLQLGYTSSEAKKFRGASPTVFHKQFSDHEYFADQINKLPNKLWKAAVHSVFENMTLSELNSFAGRKKFGGGDSTERPSLKSSSNPKDIDVSDLPKQFSWKDYLSEPREQKKCGSCYVFATMSMLEARIKIKYGKDVQLSVEHVLDCSYQNQGCHGGYPYFVGMFAKDHELVPESCSPYNNGKSHCSKCDIKSLPEHYKVSDHK